MGSSKPNTGGYSGKGGTYNGGTPISGTRGTQSGTKGTKQK